MSSQRPPTRHGRRHKRRRSERDNSDHASLDRVPNSLCGIGNPTESGRPYDLEPGRFRVLNLDGDEDEVTGANDSSVTARHRTSTFQTSHARRTFPLKEMAGQIVSRNGRWGDRGSRGQPMNPLDQAQQLQGDRPRKLPKMKDSFIEESSSITLPGGKIPRKRPSSMNDSGDQHLSFDPSFCAGLASTTPLPAHQHKERRKISKVTEIDLMDEDNSTESETETKRSKRSAWYPSREKSGKSIKKLTESSSSSETSIDIDSYNGYQRSTESELSSHTSDVKRSANGGGVLANSNEKRDSGENANTHADSKICFLGNGRRDKLHIRRGPEVLQVVDDDERSQNGQYLLDTVGKASQEVFCSAGNAKHRQEATASGTWKSPNRYIASLASGIADVASCAASVASSAFSLTKHNSKKKAHGRLKKNGKQSAVLIAIGESLKDRRASEDSGNEDAIMHEERDNEGYRWEQKPCLIKLEATSPDLHKVDFAECEPGRETRSFEEQVGEKRREVSANHGRFKGHPQRIAIGKKVTRGDCWVELADGFILIAGGLLKGRKINANPSNENALRQVRHKILLRDILEVKFYNACDKVDEKNMESNCQHQLKPFIAMRVKKTSANGLLDTLYSNAYQPDGKNARTNYILIEFETPYELDRLLAQMAGRDRWATYTNESSRLSLKNDAMDYAIILHDQGEQACSTFRKTQKRDSSYPFQAGKDTILVYPFAGDIEEIETAAKDLTCLGGSDGSTLNGFANHNQGIIGQKAEEIPSNELTQKARNLGSGTVTLSADDFLRLEPGEWLNDNVIDFVLRWISRSNDGKDSHFFSTHFYTKLANHGFEAVAAWTARKNREVNIFDKKMIFIPINKSLHWSLCVVVNPGRIKDFLALKESGAELAKNESALPCILFFDSLRSHNKAQVGRNVCKWLNKEWERVTGDVSQPFTSKSMVLHTPEVPRQDNFCDCGVFVCRYAYAMYQLGKQVTLRVCDCYSRDDIPFGRVISKNKVFQFDMSEIQLLREQLMKFILNLHRLYQLFVVKKSSEAACPILKPNS